MTQDVSPQHPESVLGDFANREYRYGDTTTTMSRDAAGRFIMTFANVGAGASPGESPVVAAIVRAVGSHRYQQYLADVGGVLWRLPMAYHVEERRWFPMNAAFLTSDPERFDAGTSVVAGQPGQPRQPTFGGGAFDRHVTRWNDNCVFCHNVAPNPGRDPATGTFQTSVAELGIACEACHGPADEHVRANQSVLRRIALRDATVADPTITNPARLSPSRSADVCGRCHGQRLTDDVGPFLARGDPFVPGDDLGLYSAPLWQDTPLHGDPRAFAPRFWDDGTPRLTAYEYQGWLQSPCAQRGALTCTTCHSMHAGNPSGQVRPEARGDAACTSCHQSLSTPAAKSAHARHDAGDSGVRCVSCHMPRVVYGVMDVHISHRIEVPDPAAAVHAGRPDACTLCHVDKDRAWAARSWAVLWPQRATPGHATVPDDDDLAPLGALFSGDPIARAVAARALGDAPLVTKAGPPGNASERQGALLSAMAEDRYPAVRRLAARALSRLLSNSDAESAARARNFDATAPVRTRQADLQYLGNALPEAQRWRATHEARRMRLRNTGQTRDIDIGE